MNETKSIKWVLFDMGNVLVKYQPQAMATVAKFYGVTEDDIATLYFDEGVAQLASEGVYTPDEFIEVMNDRFGGPASRADFVKWYTPEVQDVLSGIPELVAGLRGRVKLAVLSNTFFGHWDYFLKTPLASNFDCLMASHELGVTKPNAICYEMALGRLQANAAEVLFLDDKLENVQGAATVGIHAYLSQSIDDTRAALARVGLA